MIEEMFLESMRKNIKLSKSSVCHSAYKNIFFKKLINFNQLTAFSRVKSLRTLEFSYEKLVFLGGKIQKYNLIFFKIKIKI